MGGRFHRPEVAAALAVAVAGLGAAGASETVYRDPVGDVRGGSGPDLTAISVSHTATRVTFRFRFAKAPPLALSVGGGWVDMLLVGIDVPPRSLVRGAHGWAGLDYYAGLHGTDGSAVVVRTSPAGPPKHTVVARTRVTVSGRTLSFSIGRATLGDPAWIEFAVAAGREESDQAGGGEDEAPNRGAFHYRLRG